MTKESCGTIACTYTNSTAGRGRLFASWWTESTTSIEFFIRRTLAAYRSTTCLASIRIKGKIDKLTMRTRDTVKRYWAIHRRRGSITLMTISIAIAVLFMAYAVALAMALASPITSAVTRSSRASTSVAGLSISQRWACSAVIGRLNCNNATAGVCAATTCATARAPIGPLANTAVNSATLPLSVAVTVIGLLPTAAF